MRYHQITSDERYSLQVLRRKASRMRLVGAGSNHCIVTLVERVTGATLIGRLRCRKVADVNRRVIELIAAHRELFNTITVDNAPRVPWL